MTTYETPSIIVSLLAIVAAVVALIRQSMQSGRMKTLEDAHLRQQRATAALHEKQLEQLIASGTKPLSAQLKLELLDVDNRWIFRVTNLGSTDALDVSVRAPGKTGDHNPIMEHDYNGKFPAPCLSPGTHIDFMAAIYLGSPSSYNAVVSWVDVDGTPRESKAYVTL